MSTKRNTKIWGESGIIWKAQSMFRCFLMVPAFMLVLDIAAVGQTDSLTRKQHFELSFGHSLLFVSESRQTDIRKESAVVLPTSAILFFVEFRPDKRLRIPTFFTLPTESKQFLVNGELVNERASPTLGIGPAFKLFQIPIDDRSRIEFEVSPLVSVLFSTERKLKSAPILAARLRFRRGENFVMYLGASYSFGVNAAGLLYGTGSIF